MESPGRPEDCSKGARCPNARPLIARYGWPEPTDHHFIGGGVPEFWAIYTYTTGRAGRTTQNCKKLCRSCAEKFAKNHKLEMPPIPDTNLTTDDVARLIWETA